MARFGRFPGYSKVAPAEPKIFRGAEGPGKMRINVGGYFGLVTAAAAWYVAAADVINDTMGRTVLHVGARG